MIKTSSIQLAGTIKHTKQLRDAMPQLIAQFADVASRWSEVVAFTQRMGEHRVNVDAFLNSVYGEPKETDGNRKKTTRSNLYNAITRRMMGERVKLQQPLADPSKATLWEVFNAVQGYHQHDIPRRGGNDNAESRVWLGLDDPNVSRAMGEVNALLAV